MKKQQKLVLQHLEDVSWKILDEYPQIIKELIKGKWGVYALYKRNKLYYVGLATNLMGRLKMHLRDRHKSAWDRFSVYLTIKSSHTRELESLLIRVIDPPGNRVKGKFIASEQLRSTLNKKVKDYDDDRRAGLIGGNVEKRRRKINAKKASGTKSLKGIFSRRMKLRGTHKNKTYMCTLRKDGRISYKGKLYNSPSGAAKVVIGRGAINGWNFWKYKDSKGNWKSLSSIRK
jgi:hypothetical protein